MKLKKKIVATIYWHKWKDVLLPSVSAESLFQG